MDKVDTDQLLKLKEAINRLLKEKGIEEVEAYFFDLTKGAEGEPTIRFTFPVGPEALMGAEERETLSEFKDIVSDFDIHVETYMDKLDETFKGDKWDL